MLLMILSLTGLVFGMASPNLNMVEKIPIFIICFVTFLIAAVINTPFMDMFLKDRNSDQDQFPGED